MSAMSPEVAAVREEGLAAARDGVPPVSGCPYAEGDWRRLDWRIGHTSFWRRPCARDLKVANRARDRARARDKTAAERAARPAAPGRGWKRHVRTCSLDGCENRLPRKQRGYCCWEHYARSGALVAAGLQARAAAAEARARAARVAPPSPPAAVTPPAAAAPVTPAAVTATPVTPEMWRAACTYMDPAEMRRFLGLDETQVARVLELQKRGGRIAA